MERILLPLLVLSLVLLSGCSQHKVDKAAYRTGEITADVVDASKRTYKKAVRGSKSAYSNLVQGYKDNKDESNTETDADDEESNDQSY